MNPIATYTEARFDGKRTFHLFEDKVIVRGKATLGGDFETAIPLASLTPSFARLRSRHRAFFGGIWIMVGSSILAYVVGAISQKNSSEVVGFFCALGIAGLVLLLATAKKVEWVQFNTDAGVTVLTIARAGKEKDKFDSFVEALTSQITVARDNA